MIDHASLLIFQVIFFYLLQLVSIDSKMEEPSAKAEEETLETTAGAMKEDNAATADGNRSPESVSAAYVVSSRAPTTKKKAVVSSNLIKQARLLLYGSQVLLLSQSGEIALE